ncbi:MAG: hypothetical protein OHK0032_06080 [Thermodesulfovibrionales bacterium]
MVSRRHIIIILLVAVSAVMFFGIDRASAKDIQHRLLIQVSDDNPKTMNLALNNAMNIIKAVGQDNVEIEIVAYGPGLNLVLQKNEAIRDRVLSMQSYGVRFVACGNTMKNLKVSESELVKGVSIVEAGVLEIMEKQEKGWSYVRP